MKLRILLIAMLTGVLALGWTTASAKGLEDVSVSGPGLASPVRLSGNSANDLAVNSGFFAQTPDRVNARRPAGVLGPRYEATYRWSLGQHEPAVFRQDLYPFASTGAFTYTPPGQRVGERRPSGGWSRAGPELTLLLVAAGVPIPPSYAVPVAVVAPPPLTG